MFTEYRKPIVLYIDDKSSLDVGISVIKSNILSSPSPRREFEEVPGRKMGSVLIDEGCYDDFTLELECCLVNESEETMANIARRAKKYLLGAINSKLQTDEDLDFYLTGTYISKVDIVEAIDNFGTFQAQFRCAPIRKYVHNSGITITKKDSTLFNEFDYAIPYIKIKGTGDVVLIINGTRFEIKGVEEYIEIDSERMDCYKGEIPQNNKFRGLYFPEFDPGINTISWEGNITEIEIVPNRGVI